MPLLSEVKMVKKDWFIKAGELKQLLRWKEASGCFATDRIMVDGCKVGYMYREEPDNDIDSGWRFLAGDEDDDYMDNIGNMGIFDLNTIANYDVDIIPFLHSDYGSAFYRDNNGTFQKDVLDF